LKKQLKTKKLALQRETLTSLQGVSGGVTDYCGTSQINDTVYHPPRSEGCFTNTQTIVNA
jgi:hypothetical protein